VRGRLTLGTIRGRLFAGPLAHPAVFASSLTPSLPLFISRGLCSLLPLADQTASKWHLRQKLEERIRCAAIQYLYCIAQVRRIKLSMLFSNSQTFVICDRKSASTIAPSIYSAIYPKSSDLCERMPPNSHQSSHSCNRGQNTSRVLSLHGGLQALLDQTKTCTITAQPVHPFPLYLRDAQQKPESMSPRFCNLRTSFSSGRVLKVAAPCTLLLRPGTRLLQASQSQRQSAVCMATGIQGSIFKGLTKVFGQDVPGSQDAPQSRYFEDSAPSWEELSKVVAAERQRLDLQAPDLEAVSTPASPGAAQQPSQDQ